MFRWAAAAFLAGVTLQPTVPIILLTEGQVPARLRCVFGGEGTRSKVAVKLSITNKNPSDVLYQGEVFLDNTSLFGRAVGFSMSKPEIRVATFGAGIFTSKPDGATQQLFYSQFFITLNLNSSGATLEASTLGAATILKGKCKSA